MKTDADVAVCPTEAERIVYTVTLIPAPPCPGTQWRLSAQQYVRG